MNLELSDNQDPAALLAWHIAMGADEAISENTIDRFNAPAEGMAAKPAGKPPQKPQPQRPTPIAAKPAQPTTGAGVEAALAAASACNSIAELKLALEGFDGGLLKRSAKNTVFADGIEGAPLMVVGDIPGSEEDTVGKPFIGPAGKLLDKMLAAIGMNRTDSAYLTDFVPWRPLGNTKPSPDILAMCKPFVERHIALAKPKIVILMGGVPSKTLLNTDDSISRQRGKWKSLSIGGEAFPVMPMVHPGFLINQPLQKKNAWHDLLAVKEKLLS